MSQEIDSQVSAELRREVSAVLETAATELDRSAGTGRFVPLVDLATVLEQVAWRCSGRLRGLCFVLGVLLKDIRNNLCGDLPWDEAVGETRAGFLQAAGPILQGLAEQLRFEESNANWVVTLDCIGNLVEAYFNGLAELNSPGKGAR